MPNNEFGDFQTPENLAKKCLAKLQLDPYSRILEPTCGYGSFLKAAEELLPTSERLGIDIQQDYLSLASSYGRTLHRNIFETNLISDISWATAGPLAVIGNPPWVTSAELKRMDSGNVPAKENFKGAKGLDALLGASNFDVCEYIILKALRELSQTQVTLGMLCKTHVARNVIEHAWRTSIPVSKAALYEIDAMRWFGASVDACWLVVEVNTSIESSNYVADVFKSLDSDTKSHSFGVVNGKWVSNVDAYIENAAADTKCTYEWRSGMKHDASAAFELVSTPAPKTKAGQNVDIEEDFLYPLLKSTDIFRGRHEQISKWVIVPQKKFGDETETLREDAPRLWRYLDSHGPLLDGRKSSIYRNRPRFSVFGHGTYTYAPYKVAVSGLHKKPVFRLVGPMDDKPVVLDDTCYFLPFDDPAEAALVWALLSSDQGQAFIESLVFWDSKRPITKKLLARLDMWRLAVDREAVLHAAVTELKQLHLPVEEQQVVAILDNHPAE